MNTPASSLSPNIPEVLFLAGWIALFRSANHISILAFILLPSHRRLSATSWAAKPLSCVGLPWSQNDIGQTVDPSTSIALEDVEQLRESLARGDERVFNINVLIRVRGPDYHTLVKRSNRVLSKIRSLDFRALPTHWQHHMGLLSCLPDGNNLIVRLFGTGAAATFFPFTGSDISMDDGVMFGVQANGGLIIINPFNSKQLENANMVVFAKLVQGRVSFSRQFLAAYCPPVMFMSLTTRLNIRISANKSMGNMCASLLNPCRSIHSSCMQYRTTETIVVDEEVQKEEEIFSVKSS